MNHSLRQPTGSVTSNTCADVARNDAPLNVQLSTREECTWNYFSNAGQPFGIHPVDFNSGFHNWRCETDLFGIATPTATAPIKRL